MNYSRKTFCIIFFCGLSVAGIGQDFEINGRVADAETGLPLPYANIQIQKTTLGATTNVDGNFKLIIPKKYGDSYIRISYLGYSIEEISISKISNFIIVPLKPESRQLEDVIIMPDSSLIVFLREAYNNIKKNYPQEPYELEGFYRESLKNESDYYLYYGEAQIKIQGSGYQFEKENGNVKVLKSRINNFSSSDTSRNTLYYGGVFLPISADAVKNRWNQLRPDNKNYQYQLLATTTNEEKEVWIVGFKKLEGGMKGKLFIEKESKAYLRAEFNWDGSDSIGGNFLSHMKTMERSCQLLYKKFNDKWFLQYVGVQRRDYNKRLKSNTVIAAEFVTTKTLTDSVSLLPFMERMGYTEIFSRLENNFSDDFWKGTTILVRDSSLTTQLTAHISEERRSQLLNDTIPGSKTIVTKTRLSKQQNLLNFVRRLGFSYGAQLLPYTTGSNQLSLTYSSGNNNLSFDKSINNVGFPLLLSSEFSFRLNRRWQIITSRATDFSRMYEFKSRYVGFKYSMLLNKKGKPLLFRPELSFGSHNFAWSFPVFNNDGELIFDNKVIDKNKLQFHVGERVISIRPSFSFEKKIGGLKWVFVNTGCYLRVNQENTLYLNDKSGFTLFRKERFVPLANSGAVVLENNSPITTNPNWFANFYFEAGIRWTFQF
jgi:hypothetical protein